MVLQRYSVFEEGFWEYSIFDDATQGPLEDWTFEDKYDALVECKNLNRRQRRSSIYKQNKAMAEKLKVSDNLRISIFLPDTTRLSFMINKKAQKLEEFISGCKCCIISEVNNNSENKIEEIIIQEA